MIAEADPGIQLNVNAVDVPFPESIYDGAREYMRGFPIIDMLFVPC
jgi:hypothetical protein